MAISDDTLTPAARGVLRREAITNFCTNALLNGLFAWCINNASPFVSTTFWNVLLDIAITSFCTCVLTSLFCTAAARRAHRAGALCPLPPDGSFIADLPSRAYVMGANLGGLVGVPVGTLLGLGFMAIGVPELPFAGFVAYKALFGGVLGTLTCLVVFRRQRYEAAAPASAAPAADAPHSLEAADAPAGGGTLR